MRPETKAVKENSRELRIQTMNAIDEKPVRMLQDEMVKRMYDWRGNRVPDYESRLKPAGSLICPFLFRKQNQHFTYNSKSLNICTQCCFL